MKPKLLILCLFYLLSLLLNSINIYYGPGQVFSDFDSAFQVAQTGDKIIDCNEIDVKILPGFHYNWISFPRLDRTDKYADFRYTLDKFHDFPLPISVFHDDFLVMEFGVGSYEWCPHMYTFTSEQSFKLLLDKEGDHIIELPGDRLPVDYKLPGTLYAMSANWLGYWIPYSQNIEDAFGDQFENIFAIEAEDWFYVNSTQYIFESKDVFVFDVSNLSTPSISTIGKNFEYGKGYILYFLEAAKGFQWHDSQQEAVIVDHPQAVHFKEKQKPKYNVIDILDIHEDVIEIGVFVEDECFAAKSVQSDKEQLLVYTTWDHRGEIPYQFRILKKDMQVDTLETVAVYNKKLGCFEISQLMAGKKKYSIIKLNAEGFPEALVEQTEDLKIEIIPSPYSSQTDIKINLAKDLEIELSVYDVNNIKIKQILAGNFGTGEYIFSWDGSNDSDDRCLSGVYYAVLQSAQQTVKKKMLLLK